MRVDDPAPPADLRDAAHRVEARAARRLALLAERVGGEAAAVSDYEAATVAALVAGLVERTARGVAAAPALAGFDLDGLAVPAAARDPDLLERALARATEHRMATALKRRPAHDPLPPAGGGDAETAALELALLVAESARIDRAGDPLLPLADLPAEAAHRLAWRIGAAARARLVAARVRAAEADDAVTGAVAALLAGHDEGRGIAAAATRFARRRLAQVEAGEADALMVAMLSRGHVARFAALLAERAGLAFDAVHARVGEPTRLALTLRAAGVARPAAATLLLRVAEALALDDDRLIDAVDGFAAIDRAAAADALALDRLDPAYRAAIDERRG